MQGFCDEIKMIKQSVVKKGGRWNSRSRRVKVCDGSRGVSEMSHAYQDFSSPRPSALGKSQCMRQSLSRLFLAAALLLPGASFGQDPLARIDQVKADANIARVKADCAAISSALKMYKINAGHFPTEKQGLAALVKKPADMPRPVNWVQLASQVPKDPWGHQYFIRIRGKEKRMMVFVVSQGPDPDIAEDDIEHPVEPPKAKE